MYFIKTKKYYSLFKNHYRILWKCYKLEIEYSLFQHLCLFSCIHMMEEELLHGIPSWIDGRKLGWFALEDIKWRKHEYELEEVQELHIKLEEKEVSSKVFLTLDFGTQEKKGWDKRVRILNMQSFFTRILFLRLTQLSLYVYDNHTSNSLCLRSCFSSFVPRGRLHSDAQVNTGARKHQNT